jgi:hypothetical protein
MLIAFVTCAQAQNSVVNWSTSFHQQNGFIENQGQFDHFACQSAVRYALDEGNMVILFTDKGPTYRFSEKQNNKARKRGDRN